MFGLGSTLSASSTATAAVAALDDSPDPQKVVIYESDFSTGNDGWGDDPIGNSRITGGSTVDGESDCLLIQGSAFAFQSDSVFARTSPTMPENTTYYFQADVYVASGSYSSRGFIRVGNGANADIDMWDASSYSSLTKDQWIQVTGNGTITTTVGNWTLGLQDPSLIDTNDQFAIKNIQVYYYS